jgi:hypothetical protein
VSLAVVRGLRELKEFSGPPKRLDVFGDFIANEGLTLGEVVDDPLVSGDDGWVREPVIMTSYGVMSVLELQAKLTRQETVEVVPTAGDIAFGDILVRALLDHYFDVIVVVRQQSKLFKNSQSLQRRFRDRLGVEWMDVTARDRFTYRVAAKSGSGRPKRSLPPLAFARYTGFDGLLIDNCPLNLGHPLVAWVLEASDLIRDKYPALFGAIFDSLTKSTSDARRSLYKLLDQLSNMPYESGVRPPPRLRAQ